jgi:TRAP-type uncharacterized transport system substrate-binding protein
VSDPARSGATSIDAICNGNIQVIAVVAEKFNKYLKKVTRSCDVNIVRFSQDEIDLFNADLEDAVSGVIEDWEGTKWVASQQLT